MGRSFWAVAEQTSFAEHRVLLADSDPVSRARLFEGLSKDGHDVACVVGPNQLLYMLTTFGEAVATRPDVVIVDVTMGDGTAWEVLQTCRRDIGDALLILLAPRHAPGAFDDLTPCVVFTRPFSDEDVRTAALNAPLSRKLRQAARAVLEGRSADTSPSSPAAAESA
jgi:CheY-like chemotaxis protein